MRAMVLEQQQQALVLKELEIPKCLAGQVLIKVSACGVCRTDLHVVDGDLKDPKLPLIPGHQIVGEVIELGKSVIGFKVGQRVGVPWLGSTCGHCFFCDKNQENLCDRACYTGYQINGGFAEYCVADARYCFPLPQQYSDLQIAPLLCAGLIGYRAYKIAGCKDLQECKKLGLYGFGAAAHILIQLAVFHHQQVYAFTRKGDEAAQKFALELGAHWVGNSSESPPDALDAAIIFAPSGELVPQALKHIRKGGRVVCAGIHMSDIPSFPYEDLWGERSISSVANLTRQDGEEFLPLAASLSIHSEVHPYALEDTNQALDDLRSGRFTGAAVITL